MDKNQLVPFTAMEEDVNGAVCERPMEYLGL